MSTDRPPTQSQGRRVRRVTVVGHDNEGSREIFTAIANHHPDLEFQVVVTTGLYYRKSVVASIWKLLRESSFAFCVRRARDIAEYRLKRDTLVARARRLGLSPEFSKDVNSPGTVSTIRQFGPDLLVSLFTMHIYRDEILSLPRIMALGSHPSILPNYRGLEVFFWALANGETESGVSVFRLARRVDRGEVVAQRTFPISPSDSVRGVYARLTTITGELIADVIERIDGGEDLSEIPSDGRGSYYPMPTRAAYRAFRRSSHKW